MQEPSDDTEADSRPECQRLVAEIRQRLPQSLDGRAFSQTVKVPYHAALLDAGLSYRILELAEGSLNMVDARRFVAGAIIARACVETAALHFYVGKKVLSACDSGEIQEATDILYRALTGSTAYGDATVKPINVLTAIDHTDKTFHGIRSFYDQQSEFAHPNWWGSHGAFGVDEREDGIEFAQESSRTIDGTEVVRGLRLALVIFDYSQRKLRNAMPTFSTVCDEWWRIHGA
jgi:hypothetical protein